MDRLLTPELWASVFEVCFGISSLLGAAFMGARARENHCGYKTALRLCAFALVMIILTAGYWLLVDRGVSLNAFLIVLCLGGFAMGFLISSINIPISTELMRIVDQDMLSKVTSIISIGSQGMIPIASVLAGAILSVSGSAALLAVCALGFSVTAVMMLANPQVRQL